MILEFGHAIFKKVQKIRAFTHAHTHFFVRIRYITFVDIDVFA